MSKGGPREIIKLRSEETSIVYTTTKNKRQCPGRLSLRKYDKKLRKHVTFKETKS